MARRWPSRSILVAAHLATGMLLLMPLPAWATASDLAQAVIDGLHVPAFAAITWVTYALLRLPKRHPRARLVSASAASSVAAALVELIQVPAGRSASWADLGLGLAGVAIATAALSLHQFALKRQARNLGLAWLISAALLCQSWPVLHIVLARQGLQNQLPSLGYDQRQGWAKQWKPQNGTLLIRESQQLRLETRSGSYGGISFWPGSQDWTGYSALELRFLNPGSPFELGLRVDDGSSGVDRKQRFNGSLEVPTGDSTHRIALERIAADPETRKLDLRSVKRMALFTLPSDPPRTFFLQGALLY